MFCNALYYTTIIPNISKKYNDNKTTQSNKTINDFVKIAISDTGVGMNEEKLSKLFTSAVASTKGTEEEKGTGLGLMLCKDFVEKNGGQIWVESQIGKGSTFYFTLPK